MLLRRCVRVSHDGLRPESHSDGVAESERATRKRETVQVCHEQRVSGGLAPVSRQVGGGISLKRARTCDQPDGESLAQTSRLGRQTAVRAKMRRLGVGVVESKRRDAVATDGSRRWYGTGAVSTRGGVQAAAARPGQGGDYWRANEGCARESVRAPEASASLRQGDWN